MAQENNARQKVLNEHHDSVALGKRSVGWFVSCCVVVDSRGREFDWSVACGSRVEFEGCWNTFGSSVCSVSSWKDAGGGLQSSSVCGGARETLVSNLVWILLAFAYCVKSWNVADDLTSCYTASARGIHVEGPCC